MTRLILRVVRLMMWGLSAMIAAAVPVQALEYTLPGTAHDTDGKVIVSYTLPVDPFYIYHVRLRFLRYDSPGRMDAHTVSGDVGYVEEGGRIEWDYRGDGIAAYAGVVRNMLVCYTRLRRSNTWEVSIGLGGAWRQHSKAELAGAWYDSAAIGRSSETNGFGAQVPVDCHVQLVAAGDFALRVGASATFVATEMRWPYHSGVQGKRFLGRAYSVPVDLHARAIRWVSGSPTSYYVDYGGGVMRTWYEWRRHAHPDLKSRNTIIQRVAIGVDWYSSGGFALAYVWGPDLRGVLSLTLLFQFPAVPPS